MSQLSRLGGVSLLCCILSACGQSEKSHKPYVTVIGDQVTTLTQSEAETYCRDHECELNHLYYEEMGCAPSKDSQAQALSDLTPPGDADPVPDPEPTRSPASSPKMPTEKLGYQHGIMNSKEAWSITQGSRNVIVAVIDGGVQYTHADLKSNIWSNAAELNGKTGIDDDGNGYVDDIYGHDFYDGKGSGWDASSSGHGTHVAGIIGAVSNGTGVIGVSPKVRIMPLRFMGSSGSGSLSDAVSAVYYAIKMKADVISMSWGSDNYSSIMKNAIAAARAAGIIVVASSGNDGVDHDTNAHYPSGYPGVITVGSSTSDDKLSSFSNYGDSTVHIIAPGSSIRSTYVNGGYTTKSGTSMAAPQISGAIALALALKPTLTEAQILSDLCSSATKRLTSYSKCGRLDLGTFIKRVSQR